MASPFWREFSFPSPVDDILKKPGFTLEELLDEDDVVVDTRSQKEELKEYLMRKETLSALIKYVVDEPGPEASEAVRMRYPVVVCEILTAEVDDIERELIKNEDLLALLFDFFKPPKINLLLANLVAKIIGTLMNNKLPYILAYLKKTPHIITTLVNQIHCAITTDILVRLIGAESEYEGKGTQQWLVDIGFVGELISRFAVEHQSVHADVANAICELLSIIPHVSLFKAFLDRKTLTTLLGYSFDPNNISAHRWGLTVFHHILRSITIEMGGSNEGQQISQSSPLEDLQPAFQLALEHINDFQTILAAPSGKTITNQNGGETEAFGFHRLTVLQCIDALVNCGFSSVVDAIANNGALIKQLFGLFAGFPTNNFCHRFTEHVIISILVTLPAAPLCTFLEGSDIMPMLVEAEKNNRLKLEQGEVSFMYIPFIFSIGSTIQERAAQDELVLKVVDAVPDWGELQKAIAEERQKSEHTLGPYDDNTDSEEPYNPSLSEEENDLESDEPNDADDYDTDQAEILLTKAEIEAIG